MKYIIFDERKDLQLFTEEFEDRDEAIKTAKSDWDRRTAYDKKNTKAYYVLESVNPDEDADDHYDGNPILTLK